MVVQFMDWAVMPCTTLSVMPEYIRQMAPLNWLDVTTFPVGLGSTFESTFEGAL